MATPCDQIADFWLVRAGFPTVENRGSRLRLHPTMVFDLLDRRIAIRAKKLQIRTVRPGWSASLRPRAHVSLRQPPAKSRPYPVERAIAPSAAPAAAGCRR